MPDFVSNSRFGGMDWHDSAVISELSAIEDSLMEEILDNIHNTPVGQVLGRIAALPEVRREKILDVRRRLDEGLYDVNGRLEVALDRVLEDLTA